MTHTKEDITATLNNILESEIFKSSPRVQEFLKHSVKETLEGRAELLNGTVIAQDVFQKGAEFDPNTDTLVRVTARRLRSMLRDYYLENPERDPVVISVPKGGYRASFTTQPENMATAQNTQSPPLVRKHILTAALIFFSGALAFAALNANFTNKNTSQNQLVALSVESYPRIAVLKLENWSDNNSNDFLETGLQIRLLNDLSRFKTIRPVTYNQSYEHLVKNDLDNFDYAITGVILSVEREADMIVRLIDLNQTQIVESNRITKTTNGVDYMEAFEDIILTISGGFAAINGDIMKEELLKAQTQTESKIYTDLSALQCFSKFYEPRINPSPENYKRNYTCFKNLAATYPSDSTILAAYGTILRWGATTNEEEFGARALDPSISEEKAGVILKKAVELDPADAFAQISLSYYYLGISDIKGALNAAETAVIDNPADPDALALLSTVLAYDGQWERAILKADEAMERNPNAFYVYYRTYFLKALLDNDLAGMKKYSDKLELLGDTSASVYSYLSALANNDLDMRIRVEPLLEDLARSQGADKMSVINQNLKSVELRTAAQGYISTAATFSD